MNTPPPRPTGRPEFFILEAGEYLERLALLVRGGSPDAESLHRFARGLRGSAQMAGPPGYSVAATAIENAAKELKESEGSWSPELAGRFASAIDDCKDLLRRVREWSESDIKRCQRIADDLLRDAIVSIDALAPDSEADVVPIESLLYEEVKADAPSGYTAFEQSLSTYFRLTQSSPVERGRDRSPLTSHLSPLTETEPVPIQFLLFRGRRALERADLVRRELDAAWRVRRDLQAIEALLGELLDLVPLALDDDA